MAHDDAATRELLLVKVKADADTRGQVLDVVTAGEGGGTGRLTFT